MFDLVDRVWTIFPGVSYQHLHMMLIDHFFYHFFEETNNTMLRHVSWADNLGWLNKSFCGRIEFKDWKAHILALASSHCSSKPEGYKKTVSFCLIWRITTRKISRERARRASALPTRPLRCKPSSSSQPSTRLKFWQQWSISA